MNDKELREALLRAAHQQHNETMSAKLKKFTPWPDNVGMNPDIDEHRLRRAVLGEQQEQVWSLALKGISIVIRSGVIMVLVMATATSLQPIPEAIIVLPALWVLAEILYSMGEK